MTAHAKVQTLTPTSSEGRQPRRRHTNMAQTRKSHRSWHQGWCWFRQHTMHRRPPHHAHAPPALTLSADAGTASVSTFISSSSSSASSSGEGADEDTELSKVDTHQVHATHLKWGVKLGAGACAEVWQAEYAGKGYAIKKPKSMEEVRIAHADRTRDLARVAHAESNPYSD